MKRRRENRYENDDEEKKSEQIKKIKTQEGSKVATVHVVRESGEMFRPKSRAGGDI